MQVKKVIYYSLKVIKDCSMRTYKKMGRLYRIHLNDLSYLKLALKRSSTVELRAVYYFSFGAILIENKRREGAANAVTFDVNYFKQ